MRAPWWIGAALVASGCSDAVVLRLALPEAPPSARTAFLAHAPDALWMIDLSAPTALPALEGDPLELAVAYYAEPPDAFGVAPGPVPRAPAGSASYRLPAAEAWSASVRDDVDAPAWVRVAELPPALSSWLIPSAGCPTFAVHAHSLDTDPDVLVATPDGGALIADRDGHFSRVTAEGLVPVPALDGRPSSAAVFTPDGELWSFGPGGSGARGRIDGPATALPPAPHLDHITVAIVEVTDSGFVVHTLSNRGAIASFDGTTWATWAEPGAQVDNYGRDLALAGPGEVVAVTRLSPIVRRATRDRVLDERPTPDVTDGISAALGVPGLGVVVASSGTGQLVVSEARGSWAPLDGARTGLNAFAMARDGARIYAAGARGSMIEVSRGPDARVCVIGPLVVGAVETMVVPRPGVLVTRSTSDGIASPNVAWLERQ